MVSPFACGSFSNQEEYDLDELLSPCSTPKRSRKPASNKNPYADRGLDKFSKLLAELEGKKQKIYTQKGSEDISFVRFVYSGSDNWRPIVVKSKDRKTEKEKEPVSTTSGLRTAIPEAMPEKHEIETIKEEVESTGGCVEQCKIKEMIRIGNVDLRHPYFYLPLVMLFILMLLTVYGRSFAILCTSLGWYLVPMIKERSSEKPMKTTKKTEPAVNSVSPVISTTSENPKSKKDYTRRHSEKSIVRSSSPDNSPKSVLAGPVEKSSCGRHSHKKSW